MTAPATLPIDAGLLDRFRRAGAKIQWRDVPGAGRGRRASPAARIAHLHDEEARVELREVPSGATLVVDSGPVGALVLLLEIDRRGAPAMLTAVPAGARRGFAQGAIEGRWGGEPPRGVGGLPVGDLVELARYALA